MHSSEHVYADTEYFFFFTHKKLTKIKFISLYFDEPLFRFCGTCSISICVWDFAIMSSRVAWGEMICGMKWVYVTKNWYINFNRMYPFFVNFNMLILTTCPFNMETAIYLAFVIMKLSQFKFTIVKIIILGSEKSFLSLCVRSTHNPFIQCGNQYYS